MKKNKKILIERIKHILICMGLALFLAGIVVPSGVSHGQPRVKPEWVLPEDYPDGFHGWGAIDRIEENEIVIDEIQYMLSPSVTYHAPPGIYRIRSQFREGAITGYLKNSKDEIISLWLIK